MKKHLLLIAVAILTFNSLSFGQGSSYTGTYTTSAPIVWSGINNQTISKLAITNSAGHCISLTNCSNITIQNCKLGPSLGKGVYLYNCTNIKITNCTMDSVSTGVSANLGTGIKVTYNDVKNVQGPYPQGQMTQFNEITGGGNLIGYNVAENISGKSNPEDAISMYKSSGIAGDPIQIIGNWIRGGGPSESGGGILAGDNGGSHVLIKDNILVNPGQYGISICSGRFNSIKNNKIYSKQTAVSNIGLAINNLYTTFECSSDTIMNNEVNFTRNEGSLKNFWNPGNCGTVIGWSTNVYNPNLNESILPTKIIGRAQGTTTDVVTIPATGTGSYKIYPNSALGILTVEISGTLNNDVITIYNLKGQKAIEQSLNDSKTELNVANLNMGVYIVKLSGTEKSTEVKKVIIGK